MTLSLTSREDILPYIHSCELRFELFAGCTEFLETPHPIDLDHVALSTLTRGPPQYFHDLSVHLNSGEQLLKTDKGLRATTAAGVSLSIQVR